MCVTGSTTHPGAGSETVAIMTAEATVPATIPAAASLGQRRPPRAVSTAMAIARTIAAPK